MAEAVKEKFSFRKFFGQFQLPTLIIGGFWILILILGVTQGLSLPALLGDTIRRYGMWGVMVLAMVPSIQSGTGPNFALPIGVCCGLLAQVMAVQFDLYGMVWLLSAIGMAIIFASIIGYVYGKLMNAVKGSEMTIATYTGFAFTFLFCIVWMAAPFTSRHMGWLIGSGLRVTIDLSNVGANQILNNIGFFRFLGIPIPTGMLLFFALCCFLVWLFFRSKSGIAISAVGMNPMFARASGLNVDRSRVYANMLSTVLAAIGIIMYSQSFGYAQLYDGPLMMAFQAVAAILVGGATAQRSKIFHVLLGTLIFQGLLTNGPPVLGKLVPVADLTEILRMVLQNGIILYALTQVKGGGK